ncbi:hypothetical protein N9K16_04305 [Alphaproteobacteria bacterium]|jgi:hypothetical protein|nr:hypothetical protein [Alphaproteobacteria bacterium]
MIQTYLGSILWKILELDKRNWFLAVRTPLGCLAQAAQGGHLLRDGEEAAGRRDVMSHLPYSL